MNFGAVAQPTRYVGIDPSLTNTAVIILDEFGTLIGRKMFPSPAPSEKSWQIEVQRRESAVRKIMAYLLEMCDTKQIHILVEDYGVSQHFGATIQLIAFGTALRSALFRFELAQNAVVQFIKPTELKKFATGKGNANKATIIACIKAQYNIDFGNKDDLADAYVLARFVYVSRGNYFGATEEQQRMSRKLPNAYRAEPDKVAEDSGVAT